ncbi:hypothetical protein Pan216_15550 [Planctomycetes bacterium Pan216]|uniref:Uncharacterized protein n=1 Tax=Kolteria novifilia TaxID=2527975 RepID=A0A518B158_9BACT|nr:hypothetical protein Pan216_15550 [Planctomycetes bacterium Pan216]
MDPSIDRRHLANRGQLSYSITGPSLLRDNEALWMATSDFVMPIRTIRSNVAVSLRQTNTSCRFPAHPINTALPDVPGTLVTSPIRSTQRLSGQGTSIPSLGTLEVEVEASWSTKVYRSKA